MRNRNTPPANQTSLNLKPIFPHRHLPAALLCNYHHLFDRYEKKGVVAFLRGDLGTASALLLRASAEAKTLRPNPALATRLMQQWHTVKFEVLQPKVRL